MHKNYISSMDGKRYTAENQPNFDDAPLFVRNLYGKPDRMTGEIPRAKAGEKITSPRTGAEWELPEGTIMILDDDGKPIDAIDHLLFALNWHEDPLNPGCYRHHVVTGALVEESATVEWGNFRDRADSGDRIIARDDEPFCKEKKDFEEQYLRVGADGTYMPVNAPLDEQRKWAENGGGMAHLKDITRLQEIDQAAKKSLASKGQAQSAKGPSNGL